MTRPESKQAKKPLQINDIAFQQNTSTVTDTAKNKSIP
jgi:hypothetical protein